jgi:NitT/TauT family transport system substrate-binding protein
MLKKLKLTITFLLVPLFAYQSWALEKVKVQLAWVKQGEFHGIMNAIDQGFYRDEGLDVEMVAGGPDVRAQMVVAAGAVEFATLSPAAVIAARSNEVPLVMVTQFHQDSYMAYVGKKSRGYNTIQDIKGAKFGVWFGGGEFEAQLMSNLSGVGKDNVKWVAQKFSMIEFYEDKLDVASVTLHNELHVLLGAGYSRNDITIYNASDYGAALISDGLATTEKMIRERPDIVQKMVNGTIRGWQWGIYNGEEAAKIVLKFNPGLEYQKQVYQVEETSKLVASRKALTEGLGYMDMKDWEVSQKGLLGVKAIDNKIDLSKAYTLKFWKNSPKKFRKLDNMDKVRKRWAKNLGE